MTDHPNLLVRRVLLLSLPTVIGAGEDDSQSFEGHSFNLGLAYIAALLRDSGIQVAILDCYGEDRYHFRPSTDSAWQELGLSDDEIMARIAELIPAEGSDDLLVALHRPSEEELAARKKQWQKPAPRYTTGVLAKYARLVTGAERGAVTEP